MKEAEGQAELRYYDNKGNLISKIDASAPLVMDWQRGSVITGFDSKRQAALDKLFEVENELGLHYDQRTSMTKDEALKLALEALEHMCDHTRAKIGYKGTLVGKAMDAITEALTQPPPPPPECKTEAEQTAYAFGWWKALESVRTEQPAQEPVAWTGVDFDIKTAPPKREWVGLTDEEASWCQAPSTIQTWKRIEAKLKEKNFD